MDNLGQIIKIRDRKFRALQSAEKAQQHSVSVARQTLKDAHQNMLNYADEIKTLEAEMLSELVGKKLDKSDLLMVESILERAKENAEILLQQFNKAEHDLNVCTDQLQSIRVRRVDMHQRLGRINEVNVEYEKEARKAAIYVAETAEADIAEAAYINRTCF